MKTNPNESSYRCHHCSSIDLRIADGYARAGRVTSDCKPWPAGGILALCRDCGLVQTIVNEQWQKDCEKIYTGYTIYHQSGGIEQPVYNSASGATQVRSDAIVRELLTHVPLSAKGRLLDIGCGNGALLRACSRALPQWSLCGSEVSGKYREMVEAIPGVERLYTGSLKDIPGQFDVISLVHVIEHIPSPQSLLTELTSKLRHGGVLLLEVPDCRKNFFSLMTADHCSHFSAGMLANIVASTGYEVIHAADTWISKEITVVARWNSVPVNNVQRSAPLVESEQVLAGWQTLQRILQQVESLARKEPIGIFGTSIAATWLDAQLGCAARFFVDEDSHRIGKQHFGRPIVSPVQIVDGANVYLALPPELAAGVVQRLRMLKPNVHFICP